jgi:hypothetical protein
MTVGIGIAVEYDERALAAMKNEVVWTVILSK